MHAPICSARGAKLAWLGSLALALCPVTDSWSRAEDSPNVYQRVVRSTCVIRPEVNGAYQTEGTGWVYDAKERLIVTNDHVIRGATDCLVFFPLFEDGRIVTEQESNVVPQRAIRGTVVDSDSNLDLALVRLEKLPSSATALTIATRGVSPGDKVHSVGGSSHGSQSLWSYATGHVRQVVSGTLANQGRARVLESDIPTNPGYSGGPIVNDAGEIVGVVEGNRNDARLVSVDIERASLVAYLQEATVAVQAKTIEDLALAIARHVAAGRTSAALQRAHEGIKLEETARTYTLRAECFARDGDLESAKGDLEEALKLDGKFASAHAWLGIIARWEEDYETSLASLTKAVRHEPSSAQYRLERGLTYFEEDRYQDGRKDFVEALRLDGNSVDALVYAAACDFHLGRVQEAATALHKLVEQDIVHATGALYLGLAHEQLGDPKMAEQFFLAAIGSDPQRTEVAPYHALSELLIRNERGADAFQVNEKLLEAFPEDPQGWFRRGLLLLASNREEALASVAKAKELDPDNTEYEEGLQAALQSLEGQTPSQ